jgi:phospholipid/cholesterol/gamma-HCH transport system ATP-binding protein
MTVMPAVENAISIRDLVVDYGNRRILNGVNLDIPSGQIMVIMGGSGAGKSTLLRCILGLKKPTSGSINILGTEVNGVSGRDLHALRKQMGVAFQGGALFSSMSVAENIQLPLREHTKLDDSTIENEPHWRAQSSWIPSFYSSMNRRPGWIQVRLPSWMI